LKIYIKNMVCIRCQMVVKTELEKLGLHYIDVKIGEADIIEKILPEQLEQLDVALRKSGLHLMDNKKSILVEKIKNAIIELVHYSEEQIKVNLSDFLSEILGYDYTYLFQDDVLEEWNWDYWEKTYIEFLPGLTVEEANSTLQYNAETDTTQFSAVFIPTQRLKELKISLEAGYHLSLSERFTATFGLEFGASLFYRELRMEEKWIKRFKLDTLTTDEYDYEYRFDLLHFAPSKKGTRIYLAPSAGLNYYLDQNFDLELDIIYTQYLSHSQIGWLEDLLGVPKDSEKWFPVDSKFLIRFGLIFKY